MHLQATAFPHNDGGCLYDLYLLWLDKKELPPGCAARAVMALEKAPLEEIIAGPAFQKALAKLTAPTPPCREKCSCPHAVAVDVAWSEAGCFYVRVRVLRRKSRSSCRG